MTSVMVRWPGPGSAGCPAVRDGEGVAGLGFRAPGEAEGDGDPVRGEVVAEGLGTEVGSASGVRGVEGDVDDDGAAMASSPVC
ncbi:hypothetical protein AB0O01_35880 [Streptomyces sp. NPDC093252]|uniref:hypothetical protein n=1 Tax=Streptomyces sp. NPDC093252 TaxID=3154980 RepID=UPI00342AC4CE